MDRRSRRWYGDSGLQGLESGGLIIIAFWGAGGHSNDIESRGGGRLHESGVGQLERGRWMAFQWGSGKFGLVSDVGEWLGSGDLRRRSTFYGETQRQAQ